MKKVYVILLVVIGLYACNSSKQEKQNSKNETKQEVPEGMVYIPGGTFVMGNEGEEANEIEGPEFEVELTGFYMDVTEVTNAQFQAFVEATGYKNGSRTPN